MNLSFSGFQFLFSHAAALGRSSQNEGKKPAVGIGLWWISPAGGEARAIRRQMGVMFNQK
jgi:hypothetical protein